jgi:hypothetical protein
VPVFCGPVERGNSSPPDVGGVRLAAAPWPDVQAVRTIRCSSTRYALTINLMGVAHGVKAFLPLLKAHGEGGHIVSFDGGRFLSDTVLGFVPRANSATRLVGRLG